MPPRISLRKVCLVFILVAALFIFVSIQDGFSWYTANRYSWKHNQVEEEAPKLPPSSIPPQKKASPAPVFTRREEEDGGERPKGKAWFFKGGTEYPENIKGHLRLFPEQHEGDRIEEQLMYIPEEYQGKYICGSLPKYYIENRLLIPRGISLLNFVSIS